MLRFLLQRVLVAVPAAWAACSLVFVLAQCIPGRPFQDVAGVSVDPGAADHLRNLFGTEDPVWRRYVTWLGGTLRGEWGVSYAHREPVLGLIRRGLLNTVQLTGLALLLQFSLGTAAGWLAARRPGSRTDRLVLAAAGLLYSVPSFFIGLGLVWLFSIRLGWLPPSQMTSVDAASLAPAARWLDAATHLVLPCLALALPAAAGVALYVRDGMLSVLSRPFLTAARGRGASERQVLTNHALRNTLQPLAQLFGLMLPGVVGGSTVIEVLFAWPGMGRLAYNAVLARDEPLVLGCTLVGTLAVLLGSVAADLGAAAADPRLRRWAS